MAITSNFDLKAPGFPLKKPSVSESDLNSDPDEFDQAARLHFRFATTPHVDTDTEGNLLKHEVKIGLAEMQFQMRTLTFTAPERLPWSFGQPDLNSREVDRFGSENFRNKNFNQPCVGGVDLVMRGDGFAFQKFVAVQQTPEIKTGRTPCLFDNGSDVTGADSALDQSAQMLGTVKNQSEPNKTFDPGGQAPSRPF